MDIFRIFHQNIAGLCNKIDVLELTLDTLNREVDVLCFCETNVKKGMEANIKLHNYKLASSFSRNKNKGGTCILVKSTLEIKTVIIPPDLAMDFYFECCATEIIGLNIIIINIYRVPKQTKTHLGIFIYKLDKLLDYVTNKFEEKKIVICGDWNINILKPTPTSKDLIDTLNSYNFNVHILSPTRQNACLDQIASNINVNKVNSELLLLNLSDHESAQILNINIQKQTGFITWFENRRDYSKENFEKFVNCISALSFSEVLASNNTEEAFDIFYATLCMFFDLCFPIIRVKINNKLKRLRWITKGLKKMQ